MRPTGCARTGRGSAKIAANVARICCAPSKTVMAHRHTPAEPARRTLRPRRCFRPGLFPFPDAFKERYVKTPAAWVMIIWLSESLRSLSVRYGGMRISTHLFHHPHAADSCVQSQSG